MGATSQLTVLPAAASPRSALVMDRLQATRVLFAAPSALYLLGDDGRTVLSVVTADGLALPGAVRLALSSTRFAWGVGQGEAVLVGAGSIQLPQVRIEVRRVWRPARVDEPAVIGDHDSPAALPTAPLWPAPVWPAPVWPDLVSPGEVSSSRVAALVGAGPGLTPAGDDALCGALLMARALGHPAQAALARLVQAATAHPGATTALSAALLADAAAGYGLAPVVALVDALARGDVRSATSAVGAVAAIGHTSGLALLAGIFGTYSVLAQPC